MNLSNKIYLKFVCRNINKHAKCDDVISAFIYDIKSGIKHYINFSHPDVPSSLSFEQFKDYIHSLDKMCEIYVLNKKKYKYWLNGCQLIDTNLFTFIKSNKIPEEIEDNFEKHLLSICNFNDFNIIVPYVIHQRKFDSEIESLKKIFDEKTDTYCFKFFNNVVTDTLYEVEKNGLKVNIDLFNKFFKSKTTDEFVYTDYHIYNPTGRPSNCFDGVNYVALKKDDGSRSSFISRYENGYLLMIDFTGFHPYIVANLIGYRVPENETIYEHLAKYYYNVQQINPSLLLKSKKQTMVNLYGQINDQYLNIEFFKKTEELKQIYWEQFLKNGYVTTPVYKRKITTNHVLDANKNKLFAYIIQAAETEYGMDRLNECIKYLINKPVLPILYNYDAILFDVGTPDQSVIEDLIEIVKNKKFKVKVYKGNNYHDLIQM